MTGDDPFLKDFGISAPDLHARLTTLGHDLSAMAEDIHKQDGNVTIEHLAFSTRALSLFFGEIPLFAGRQLMNCQDLVANDLDRVGNGWPAVVIRTPPEIRSRPQSYALFLALKGWAAAYMELLHGPERNIKEASEKAARDIDGQGWKFAGGHKGSDRLTASRVRSWRNQCKGFVGEPNEMTETFKTMIELAEESGLTGDAAAAMILQRPIKPAERGQLPESC